MLISDIDFGVVTFVWEKDGTSFAARHLLIKKYFSVQAFCGHVGFPIYQGAFQSFYPVKKKSPSQMKSEEARRNEYCLNKLNHVYVERTEDKKSSKKTLPT